MDFSGISATSNHLQGQGLAKGGIEVKETFYTVKRDLLWTFQEFLRRPVTCKGEVRDGCPLLWPVCVCVVCVCVCVRVCSPLALAIQTYSNKKGEN
jgi:hypothetical protein